MSNTITTLPRTVPPLEKIQIDGKPLPKELLAFLKQTANNLYDLRDFVINWHVDNEIPGGTQNGTNKNFTLSYSPMPPESLRLYRSANGSGAGQLLIFGIDYVLTGASIAYQTAPSNTDVIRAYYRRANTASSVTGPGGASTASGSATPPPGPTPSGSGGTAGGAGGGGLLMSSLKPLIYVSAGFANNF